MHDIGRTQLEVGEVELAHATSSLSESQELQIASELLEVSSEQELEQFLGKLLSRGARAAGQFIRSDTGRALGNILKDGARQALPILGRGVGEWIRPGAGAKGARFASGVGKAFGLELEGLSPEDREFELARQFVRFAGGAGRAAASLYPHLPPAVGARRAALAAARNYAPGLIPYISHHALRPRRGTWRRRGNSIEIYGV